MTDTTTTSTTASTNVPMNQTAGRNFFATCPLGVADLLAAELKAFGAEKAREMKAGVEFVGTLETAYRACLWSRVANRILMPITQVAAHDVNAMYQGLQRIDWSRHVAPEGTFIVDFQGTSLGIKHTQFGALKTKDAIVDQFRAAHGVRPSISADQPDIRINVHAHREQATVSIDLSGESLHRRGYRARGVAAPLKENLAAAILLRSTWPQLVTDGYSLLDPLCGSGTLLIEAALMACDIAPGWLRSTAQVHWGMVNWRGHDRFLWQRLDQEVKDRAAAGRARHQGLVLRGFDQDAFAVRSAHENIARAGLNGLVHVERRSVAQLVRPAEERGLLVTNPPYGERLGEQQQLESLYAELGARLRSEFAGWKAAVFTGNPPLAKQIGIHAKRSHTLFNGALECRLLRFDVEVAEFNTPEHRPSQAERLAEARASNGADMFANRLRKNLKAARTWAKRQEVTCYRVYDADMPEYSFAIDWYGSADDPARGWAYVQEYAAPDTVNRDAARQRRMQVLSVLPEVLELPTEAIHVRTRRQQADHSQYEKLDSQQAVHVVREGPYRLQVNFTDYLDTGLFLDHRLTRQTLGELARGKRFLNLFAYTGVATVHAVGGGAISSTTVDMSNTYLEWALRNMDLNDLRAPAHEFIQADCLQWLQSEAQTRSRQYDLIFLDPPTFSRSKRMEEDFEVQRDHVRVLAWALRLLAPEGLLVFSNNFTRFKLDRAALEAQGVTIEDWTRRTLPKDFERNPRIHQCFALKQQA